MSDTYPDNGSLPIEIDNGVTSAGNSTSTLLTNTSIFVGTAELNDFPDVMVSVETDQNGVLYMEFSIDGLFWGSSISFQYNTARINAPHVLVKGARYYRTRFENNSGSDQTYLRIQTEFGTINKLTAPLNGTLSENYDATVVRPSDYKSEVAMGKRQGRSTVQKWGHLASTAKDTQEIVAEWGGAFDPTTGVMLTADTFDIEFNAATDGLGTTGALTLLIDYLDAEFNLQQATHTLSGATPDVTAFTGLGINRVVALTTGSLGWNANDITFKASTAGTTQAVCVTEGSTTDQLMYHVPINHKFLTSWFWGNVIKLAGGSAPKIIFRLFSWSRTQQTRYQVGRLKLDTAVSNSDELKPPEPFVIGGREVLYVTIESDTLAAEVDGRFAGILERVV